MTEVHVDIATARGAATGSGGAALPRTDAQPLALIDFYRVLLPGSGKYALWAKDTKRHDWANSLEDFAAKTRSACDRADVYFATAAYGGATNDRGEIVRTQTNVVGKKCFYLDIDVGAEKLAKHGPGEVYATNEDAQRAVVEFCKAVHLPATMVVHSGGGLHIYFALAEAITPAEWQPLAEALGDKAKLTGLKADPAVTTDSTRLLRPVGALHANGNRVRVLKFTGKLYTVDELRRLLDAEPNRDARVGVPERARRDVNAGLKLDEFPPASAVKAAERCAALRGVVAAGGAVAEPLWRAMLGVVKFSLEGNRLAHEWSQGDKRYDRVETQAKLDRWSGSGPTTCAEFERQDPASCAACAHRGSVRSPLQLGTLTAADVHELSGPGREAAEAAAPAYVKEMNKRYAVVRAGSKYVILDRETPEVTRSGVTLRAGFLDIEAFRLKYSGQNVDVGGSPVNKAAAWLRHPMRQHYEGIGFAPGIDLGPTIFNTWQGFDVPAIPGDVGPWLELLGALIPDSATATWVRNWLGWKIQNPGGVPGTILILSGAKGAGKNSLVDPIVDMFGPHGAVFDDAEQVAGRFTWHLMSIAFAVLDEALFAGNPQQNDRIKARVTARRMTYEAKGRDPVSGVNRTAYVSLSNHADVWAATTDERRPVVVSVGDRLRGDRDFWRRYHAWVDGGGASALLAYLKHLDLSGFDVRMIPRTTALREQIARTALKDPAVSWWWQCLEEGEVRTPGGAVVRLSHDGPTDVPTTLLADSFQSAARGTRAGGWAQVSKALRAWAGNPTVIRPSAKDGARRGRMFRLDPLPELRSLFTAATGAGFVDE